MLLLLSAPNKNIYKKRRILFFLFDKSRTAEVIVKNHILHEES